MKIKKLVLMAAFLLIKSSLFSMVTNSTSVPINLSSDCSKSSATIRVEAGETKDYRSLIAVDSNKLDQLNNELAKLTNRCNDIPCIAALTQSPEYIALLNQRTELTEKAKCVIHIATTDGAKSTKLTINRFTLAGAAKENNGLSTVKHHPSDQNFGVVFDQ